MVIEVQAASLQKIVSGFLGTRKKCRGLVVVHEISPLQTVKWNQGKILGELPVERHQENVVDSIQLITLGAEGKSVSLRQVITSSVTDRQSHVFIDGE